MDSTPGSRAFSLPREPVRPSETRIRRLRELGEWHDEWAATHGASAGFHPDQHPKPGSDYNQHHVDLDATPEAEDAFHARARQIMGLPPAS